MGSLFGLLVVVLVLVLAGGSVLGWIALFSIGRLQVRLKLLEDELAILRGGSASGSESVSGEDGSGRVGSPASPPPEVGARFSEDAAALRAAMPPADSIQRDPAGWAGPTVNPSGGQAARGELGWLRWVGRVREHWMVWLGGFCVALAGVFLVRYSIEQGYLGPAARVGSGLVFGLALHGLAEWLRRRVGEPYDALAALAGGASLTLFAAVLAALHLYELWPPAVVFVLLAAIAFGTMLLALRHGPVLATLGILGAFAVPALLGGEATQLLPVLIYALIVTAGSLSLMRYVYRDWLWWGTLAGALFWWWVALRAGAGTEAWLGAYLAVLGWSLLALPAGNYGLTRPVGAASPVFGWRHWLRAEPAAGGFLRAGLVLLLAALAYGLAVEPHWDLGPLVWLPLPALLLFASRYDARLAAMPWLTVAAVSVGLLGGILVWDPLHSLYGSVVSVDPSHQRPILGLLALLALLFGGAGTWHLSARPRSDAAASFAFMAPLVVLALAHALVPESVAHWTLAGVSLGAGLVLGGLAAARLRAGDADHLAFWQIAAAHLAYSLAAVIAFEQATLTLALALQVLSLTWLTGRFRVPGLHWLVKLVLAVVVVRLTVNPWIIESVSAGHWVLWTYGGSLVLVLASTMLPAGAGRLGLWLRAASVHLLLLFVHVAVRYWLYDGEVFAPRFEFIELALNTSLWAALALNYFRLARSGHAFGSLYRVVAGVLMLFALIGYLMLLTAANPLWVPESAAVVGTSPILNLLLVAYGVPALLWGIASRIYEPDLRSAFAWLAGVGAWVFISIQIRHFWQGAEFPAASVTPGELYTYSIVWLLMAVGAILWAAQRRIPGLYRGGMVLLILVILKIFFVDLGGLAGLLRAVSFMGLGLSLLGLAFAHQFLQRRSGASGQA